jgi:N-acetylglucosaminyldiphosphoundecaprenol N-acetyl-beta-D-mannosaminyltransferase
MFQEKAITDFISAAPDRRRVVRSAHRRERRDDERVVILDEPVDLLRPEELMLQIDQWVEASEQRIIANHNLHSLYLVRREPGMREIYDRADVVQLDSAPLLHFARLLGLHSRPFHRCTYLDWRNHFWSLANRRCWRVMYVGGDAGVADTAAWKLRARYPRATIAAHSGYFDAAHGSAGNTAVVEAVGDFAPDVLFVGMGMPRQELWIMQNLAALPDAVILPVGAAFDYEGGVQKAAPRWMGPLGLEWLFRLAVDPRRLFTRYCVEPWFLLGPALADIKAARDRRSPDR